MKAKAVILLTILILISCSPQKRLIRLLDRHPYLMEEVSNDTIIYEDSLVVVEIPGDTVWNFLEIYQLEEIPDTSLKATTEFAEASAGISSGKLWLELIQTDTMMVFQLDSVLVTRIDTVFSIIPVPEKIKPNPFWKHGFFVLAGLVLISLILLFLFQRWGR